MVLAVSIFGVAFAAFCVWLTVRIYNRRERWATRTAAALVVLLVLYPLSAGPFTWLVFHGWLPDWAMPVVHGLYRPLEWIVYDGHQFHDAFEWYIELWRSR
jgi:hypothetical protein